MAAAGKLKTRASFERRALDDQADRLGDWTVEFERDGDLIYLRGGEGVLAERLSGRQPAVLTLRDEDCMQSLNTDWRGFLTDQPSQTFGVISREPSREKGPRFVDVVIVFGRADGQTDATS